MSTNQSEIADGKIRASDISVSETKPRFPSGVEQVKTQPPSCALQTPLSFFPRLKIFPLTTSHGTFQNKPLNGMIIFELTRDAI
jgi:hypothetical protein